jgi:thymidylate kinase
MADEFGFVSVDATRPIQAVFNDLRTQIKGLLEQDAM